MKTCVRLGEDENETSRFCHWHIPAAHELESWSDVRAFDGTASIIQPLIEPLYDGKTAHEFMDALLTAAGARVLRHRARILAVAEAVSGF